MLNLLFISSHPKIDIIRKALQPSLKIKIDVVGNFDIGLKEVFDKRAALVFIQDRIAGVTGESVARHIQLLLGSGAPSFIYMHDGNPKAKPIKGVCDHLIDLSQDNTKLLADIHATLKLRLGAQWQRFYIPPKANVPDILPTLDVPEGQRVNADSLEEYSISNLEEISPLFDNYDQLPETIESEASTEALWQFKTSTLDQLKKVTKTIARKRYQAIAVAVILGLIGGSWHLFKPTPHPKQTVIKESIQANVPVPVTAAPAVQQSISSTDVLPSFIPVAGHDRAFALQKPGWERYVGTDSEFRVFLSNGKFKAVQVLATNGHVISESRLKTILIELTGTGEYSISSHEEQFGFQVSRATVNPKADLLIYRKKSAVHAFVVSLD